MRPTELVAYRREHGWSRHQLARALNVGENTVARWERGVTTHQGRLVDLALYALAVIEDDHRQGGCTAHRRRPPGNTECWRYLFD